MEITLGKYNIIITDSVINVLQAHIQHNPKDLESGGILLGKLTEKQIEVMKASIPTQFDKATRVTFERNKISAQIIIDYEFANSAGQTTYLGEWHTHPEPIPNPSDTDNKMIRQQFTKNIILTDFILLVIQGQEKIYFSILSKKDVIYTHL